jgi:histidyl-tRNA synthetase
MNTIIPAVKGTRDFYPEQMALRNWIYKTVRKVSESFGYQEWDAPFLETLNLYAAKSGDELVREQSYVFKDRGGDEITLRPELTPSLARMIAQKQKELVFPARWWSWGPFWRYERPQKGRTREFFQWNIDMLGANSPEADAEIVAILASFFQEVRLSPDEVTILVNNRRLVDQQLEKIGIESDKRALVTNWIDRRGKMAPKEWEILGKERELSAQQISQITTMLENSDLWKESEELIRFFNAIEALGVKNYVRFDPNIMRGLLYYTGIVFEAWDVGGDIKRAINGGGRYDNLLRDVGGESLSGTGYAMGDVVLSLLLEKYGLLPDEVNAIPAPVLITAFSEELILDSLQLAANLRQQGWDVISYPEPVKLQKQFKFADRMGIPIVLVMGPDEKTLNNVTIKNLPRGMQETVPIAKLAESIKSLLEGD